MIELVATVTGTVQGVRYRAYVESSAVKLGLVGSVQNMSDGSVRVVAQGLPDVLKEFVEYLHEGSLLSRVEGVAVEWSEIRSPLYDFSIISSV
jgi:acylphosphatase